MERKTGLLTSFRVLDLTNEKGFLCGKLLADLGADVIKIEKPGGDQARHIGPFYQQDPHSEKSLYWFAYNANKRGITLDIETKDGQQILKRLASKADFIIESFPSDYMDRIGLGYSDLCQINPRIIFTSITPFGHTGPYKDYKASDLVVMAMSGLMYITGKPDGVPLRISFPQAFLLAASHAAAASMIAHYHRERTGEGQHVDVSAQECVLWEISNAVPLWELNQKVLKRVGSYLTGRWSNTYQKLLWPCVDGYVVFYVLGGAFGVKTNKAVIEWMKEEGIAPQFLVDFDWANLDMGQQTIQVQNEIEEHIAKLFLKHTKEELYQEAQKRGIMLCPVSTAKDISENKQLIARDFWQEIQHPEISANIAYPGVFAKLSETPLTIRKRAPLPGENNSEIYESELGLSKSEIDLLYQSGII